ncbi:MAG: hypothetical protein WAO76_02405 [Georgfuchsia sp.]
MSTFDMGYLGIFNTEACHESLLIENERIGKRLNTGADFTRVVMLLPYD